MGPEGNLRFRRTGPPFRYLEEQIFRYNKVAAP
jgi:hypothetical protein